MREVREEVCSTVDPPVHSAVYAAVHIAILSAGGAEFPSAVWWAVDSVVHLPVLKCPHVYSPVCQALRQQIEGGSDA